jgi:hypothetical protein
MASDKTCTIIDKNDPNNHMGIIEAYYDDGTVRVDTFPGINRPIDYRANRMAPTYTDYDTTPSSETLNRALNVCNEAVKKVWDCIEGAGNSHSGAPFETPRGGGPDSSGSWGQWGTSKAALLNTDTYQAYYDTLGGWRNATTGEPIGREQEAFRLVTGMKTGDACGLVNQRVTSYDGATLPENIARCIISEGIPSPDSCEAVEEVSIRAIEEDNGVNPLVVVGAALAVDGLAFNGLATRTALKTAYGTCKGLKKLVQHPGEACSGLATGVWEVLSDPNRHAYNAITSVTGTIASNARNSIVGRCAGGIKDSINRCIWGTASVTPTGIPVVEQNVPMGTAIPDTIEVAVHSTQPPKAPTHAEKVAATAATRSNAYNTGAGFSVTR